MWQVSQTRTGLAEDANCACWSEQAAQKISPHERQWCYNTSNQLVVKETKWFRVLTLRRARLNSFSHSPQWVTSSSGAHWASLETQTVASLLGKGKYNLSQIFDDKQFRNLNHFRLSASNLVSRNRTPTSSRAFS